MTTTIRRSAGIPRFSAKWACIPLLLAALLTPGAARAQEGSTAPRFEADRPSFALPPGVLSPGYIQAESGFTMEQKESGSRTTRIRQRALTYPALLARLGVLPGIELQAGGEYLDETMVDIRGVEIGRRLGLRRIAVGAKIRIREEDGTIPAATFLLKLSLPFGHEDLRPAFTAPSFLLTLRNSLGGSLKLTYSVGGEWDGVNAPGHGLYAAALSAAFTSRASAFAEVHGGVASGEHPIHSLGAGITFRIGSSVQLDLSGGKGLTLAAPDSYLGFGVSVRFPRLPNWIY